MFIQKISDGFIIILWQLLFVIYIIIFCKNLHIVHGVYIQITGSPACQNGGGNKQEDGKHERCTNQSHCLTGCL